MSFWGRHKKRWSSIFGSSSSGSAPPPVPPAVIVQDYPGVISLAASVFRAVEGAPVVVQVNRLGGSVGAASVNYATGNLYTTASYNAAAGVDYTAVSGTLEWADGDTTPRFITVPTLQNVGDDAGPFGDGVRYFAVTLTVPQGIPISGSRGAACHIVDDDSSGVGPAYFRPTSLTYKVVEYGASLVVSVARGGSLNGIVSVDVDTANGTALDGTHYTAANDTLTWADGEGGVKTLSIPIINVGGAGGNKVFYVDLSSPVDAVIDSGYEQITITIIDDESFLVAPGELSIQEAASVGEAGGSVSIQVSREIGSTGAVSVDYVATDGTAIEGEHFTATSGTLTWADGDAATKTITVPILDNALVRTSKVFTVVLSNPAGGATIDNGTCTVGIIEDDKVNAWIADGDLCVVDGAVVPSDGDWSYSNDAILVRMIGLLGGDGGIGPSAPGDSYGGSGDVISGSVGSLDATPPGGDTVQSIGVPYGPEYVPVNYGTNYGQNYGEGF